MVRLLHLLLSFNLSFYKLSLRKCLASTALASDVSQGQTSRRPDVPQQTSHKGSRKARGLATDGSQGQAYLLPSFLPIFLPCLFVFLPFGSVFASFGLLTFLSTSYLKKCLASTGLATDVSQGQAYLLSSAIHRQAQRSRNRCLAKTGVPTFISLVHLSEPFVWLLYLLLSFTLSFCKLTEEHSRKQRGLATDVSQGQTSTDVSQGQTSRNRRLARTGMPTSLFSSYFSSVLVHLPSLWFGYCTSFCPLTFLSTSYP